MCLDERFPLSNSIEVYIIHHLHRHRTLSLFNMAVSTTFSKLKIILPLILIIFSHFVACEQARVVSDEKPSKPQWPKSPLEGIDLLKLMSAAKELMSNVSELSFRV